MTEPVPQTQAQIDLAKSMAAAELERAAATRVATTASEANTKAVADNMLGNTNLGTALKGLGEHLKQSTSEFSRLEQGMLKYTSAQKTGISELSKHKEGFSALSTMLFTVKERFNDFSGVSVNGLTTLTGSISQLTDSVKISALATALLPASLVAGFAGSTNAIGQAKAALDAFARSADNAARLQNAMIQAAGKAGSLQELYTAAGTDMEGMNSILQKQASFFGDVSQATGIGTYQVAKYWHEFAQIPKVMIDGKNSLDQSVNGQHLLAAALQVASGTGRDQSEVIQEMKQSMIEYNMSGEKALTFSARMTELSGALAIPLDKMQGALKGVADRFKLVGDNTEGASKMFLTYVEALKSTGISGAAALGIVTHMTEALGGMNIAQKAFLSSQSGGAGGLMGGFQVEKMMREGKMDQVMSMVQKQMKQQFGRIVTLDEASKSQEAASQMQKQVMMLQGGPLGQFAKKPEEAYRLLEGMKGLETGKVTPKTLQENVLGKTMDHGVKIQEMQLTELQRMNLGLERAGMFRDITNLGTAQQGIGARAGQKPTEGEPDNTERQAKLKRFKMQGGAAAAGSGPEVLAAANRTDKIFNDIIKNFGTVFTDMGGIIKSKVTALRKSLIGGAKATDQKATYKELQDSIAAERKKAKSIKLPADKKTANDVLDAAQKSIDEEFNVSRKAVADEAAAKTAAKTAAAKRSKKSNVALDSITAYMADRPATPPAEAVGGAATGAASLVERANKTRDELDAGEKKTADEKATAAPPQEITIKGYCIDCGRPMEPTPQSRGVNATR